MNVVKEKYADFGPTLAAEKLEVSEKLKIHRASLRGLMMKEGLWEGKRRKEARVHQSRERRGMIGELVQIDGSHHDWFEGRRGKCCLLVFIDDATSRLMELRFEESETTIGYMKCVKNYIIKHGVPLAFYSDKDSVFTVNKPCKIDGLKGDTQFGRAMKELKIALILAHSPQAKGRVERANGTLQDRLVKELRLRGINTLEEANKYLAEFMVEYNSKFGVKAALEGDAHREADKVERLEEILSIRETRKLSKNLEFSYYNKIYQVKREGTGYTFRHAVVDIYELLDGSIIVKKGSERLKYEVLGAGGAGTEIANGKELNRIVDNIAKEVA
jgi:hypothetical protein